MHCAPDSSRRNRAPDGPGLQLSLQREDGTEVPVEISLSPLTLGANQGVVAIVRDVTERLRAESILRTTSDLLTLAGERERIAATSTTRCCSACSASASNSRRPPSAGRHSPDRIEHAVDEIDLIIREIRTAVFTLRFGGATACSARAPAPSPQAAGARLLATGTAWTARWRPPRRPGAHRAHGQLAEALTNVARHANATEAEIELVESTCSPPFGCSTTGGRAVGVRHQLGERPAQHGRAGQVARRRLLAPGPSRARHRAAVVGAAPPEPDEPSRSTSRFGSRISRFGTKVPGSSHLGSLNASRPRPA
ncbi:MAG: PAS domain S-box protein [Ilumatobacteraceae bacterium]